MQQLSPIEIERIKSLFSNADSLIISAGAGMGVDSGLPDFRGNQGMWQTYLELGKQRIDFMDIANPAAFRQTPRLAWGFYGHRLDSYRHTQPHQGFYLLKQLAEKLELPYFVFTSNVDGQFQKAGFNASQIYECHGSIHHLQCFEPCDQEIWSADQLQPEIDKDLCQWLGDLPKCSACGSLARPNVLMFNDDQWIRQRNYQQYKRLEKFIKQYHHPVVIEIGAGTAIATVRGFSERFAPQLIRINLREAMLPSKGGVSIAENAVIGIQNIYQILVE